MDSMSRSSSSPDERPRLLILTPDFPPAPGGIQVVAHRLAVGIEAFATEVVAPDSPGAERFDAAGDLRVHRVRGGGWPRGGQNVLLNAAALRRAVGFRPDVTLSIHLVLSPAAAAIRRTLGARTVQYFHAEEIASKPALAAFAAREADASIAVSAYTASLVAATGAPGAPPRRVSVIANGTDIPADAAPQPADRPTILTIARIEERYKGHDVMVRALALTLASVPDAQWVVIGDGSLRPAIEQLARSYGVEGSISFLGAVSDEERNAWLRRADLLAMPSRLPAGEFAGEGFGIVYLEAGAYGKPVIAGNVGGALDAVIDGETGILVDPLDPLAVADAITRLLRDKQLAARLGSAGRARAQRFAWPHVVQRVEQLLLAQLEQPPADADADADADGMVDASIADAQGSAGDRS
jgi:phosphatidyl-myo-inositol dimannoside synthase